MMMMTSKQYRDALVKLGLSQLAAGRLFGVGSRTTRRWALDEARIPPAVAMLLNLMVKKKLRLEIPIINEDTHRLDDRQIWELSAASTVE